jgi:hypothetical protein
LRALAAPTRSSRLQSHCSVERCTAMVIVLRRRVGVQEGIKRQKGGSINACPLKQPAPIQLWLWNLQGVAFAKMARRQGAPNQKLWPRLDGGPAHP